MIWHRWTLPYFIQTRNSEPNCCPKISLNLLERTCLETMGNSRKLINQYLSENAIVLISLHSLSQFDYIDLWYIRILYIVYPAYEIDPKLFETLVKLQLFILKFYFSIPKPLKTNKNWPNLHSRVICLSLEILCYT